MQHCLCGADQETECWAFAILLALFKADPEFREHGGDFLPKTDQRRHFRRHRRAKA